MSSLAPTSTPTPPQPETDTSTTATDHPHSDFIDWGYADRTMGIASPEDNTSTEPSQEDSQPGLTREQALTNPYALEFAHRRGDRIPDLTPPQLSDIMLELESNPSGPELDPQEMKRRLDILENLLTEARRIDPEAPFQDNQAYLAELTRAFAGLSRQQAYDLKDQFNQTRLAQVAGGGLMSGHTFDSEVMNLLLTRKHPDGNGWDEPFASRQRERSAEFAHLIMRGGLSPRDIESWANEIRTRDTPIAAIDRTLSADNLFSSLTSFLDSDRASGLSTFGINPDDLKAIIALVQSEAFQNFISDPEVWNSLLSDPVNFINNLGPKFSRMVLEGLVPDNMNDLFNRQSLESLFNLFSENADPAQQEQFSQMLTEAERQFSGATTASTPAQGGANSAPANDGAPWVSWSTAVTILAVCAPWVLGRFSKLSDYKTAITSVALPVAAVGAFRTALGIYDATETAKLRSLDQECLALMLGSMSDEQLSSFRQEANLTNQNDYDAWLAQHLSAEQIAQLPVSSNDSN